MQNVDDDYAFGIKRAGSLWAADLMATHSNGISALQLQNQLGLGSYKSAWMLCAKLRRLTRRLTGSPRSTRPSNKTGNETFRAPRSNGSLLNANG